MTRKNQISILFVFSLFIINLNLSYGQDIGLTQTGMASYYGDEFEGRQTASGEKYYHARLTAAHNELPFGTIVKVTNLQNDKTIAVRINDRGPFKGNRIIDLSRSAAEKLDFLNEGLAKVKIEVIDNINEAFDKSKKPGNKLYTLSLESVEPSGKFGIQLGSFRKMENFISSLETIGSGERDNYYLEIVRKEGKELYRMVYGLFTTRKQAEHKKTSLKNEFPGCFVVSFP